jgi:hypothetical protein
MRERLEHRAAENGRSMSAEVVEAIEKHLTSADRVTQLWERLGRHQEYIEAIPMILSAIGQIETYLKDVDGRLSEISGNPLGGAPAVLNDWIQQKRHVAYLASLPLVTADQVQTIKARLIETATNEERFLALMHAPRIEEIRGFEVAMDILDRWRHRETIARLTEAVERNKRRNRTPT